MASRRREREFWTIHAEWQHGVETPGESVRRLQRFVAAITQIAPIFAELVVSPGEERFSHYTPRRLVNVLKRNPFQESEIRSDPCVSYSICLVVPPQQGEQSGIDLQARFCSKRYENHLHLSLGDITRPLFAPLAARDWVAIIEQLAIIFEPTSVTMSSGVFWDNVELRSLGWANYVSRDSVQSLPTLRFPAVIPVERQGAIYLCSRKFKGETTKEMLATARELNAAMKLVACDNVS